MTVPIWTVPEAFVASRGDDTHRQWALSLAGVAEGQARKWDLTPAGDPMWGYVSVVWPVRGPDGEHWALKVGQDDPRNRAEGSVLKAWQGKGAVEVVRHDDATGALLLDALDPARDLESVADEAAATAVVGGFIARLKEVRAPDGVPLFTDELRRIHSHVLARRDLAVAVAGLTRHDFDRALDILTNVATDLDAGGPWPAMHGDLHYCNVLHTREGAADPGWRVIDPLPMLGPAEADLIAPLRNRWDDAVATGDPDRALRRRLDQLCEVADLDRPLAEALCHAVAVDNVSWIRLENPMKQDRFLAPYEVMAAWR